MTLDRTLAKKHLPVYVLLLPGFISVLIFSYIPLFGLIVAFKEYDIFKGFFRSPWADQYGFKYILKIFQDRVLMDSIWNTLKLSVLNLAIGFPAPILLALLINEFKNGPFKKIVQTVSYMPHFLSWISVIGLTMILFSEYGPINSFLSILDPDRKRQLYLSRQNLFLPLLLGLNLWKTIGFSSIVYIATISSIDPQLYDAAMIDGAGKWRQALHITLPGLSVITVLLLVLSIGGILSSNFELVYGLQNAYIDFETIDTIVYKKGIMQRGYSTATALGLIRGLIGMGLTLAANRISLRMNQVSII